MLSKIRDELYNMSSVKFSITVLRLISHTFIWKCSIKIDHAANSSCHVFLGAHFLRYQKWPRPNLYGMHSHKVYIIRRVFVDDVHKYISSAQQTRVRWSASTRIKNNISLFIKTWLPQSKAQVFKSISGDKKASEQEMTRSLIRPTQHLHLSA